ncbi:MAG: response regulator [Bdellovibrionales bacterium]|nr:response regulator [Bdellovibrionales bacterium]
MNPHAVKILVVDDEEDIRELLHFIIENLYDCEILEAENGNKAVDIIKTHKKLSVILCDRHMPEGNALTVYRYLCENNLKIPFILLDNNSSPAAEEFDQADGFLQKPFSQKSVFDTLTNVLSNDHSGKKSYFKVLFHLLYKFDLKPFELFIFDSDTASFKRIKEKNVILDKKRVEKYLSYLRQENQYFYIQNTDVSQFITIYQSHYKSQQVETDDFLDKIHGLIESFEIAKEFCQKLGWSDDIVKTTEFHLKQAITEAYSVKELKPYIQALDLSQASKLSSHNALIAFLCIGLLKALNINDPNIYYIYSVAALIHDITLSENQIINKQDFILAIKNNSFVGLIDLQKIKEHPLKTCEIAKEWPSIKDPELLERLILNHHESPDGKGFPNQKTHGEMDLLECVFIIAESLTHSYLLFDNKQDITQLINEIEPLYQESPYSEVYQHLL